MITVLLVFMLISLLIRSQFIRGIFLFAGLLALIILTVNDRVNISFPFIISLSFASFYLLTLSYRMVLSFKESLILLLLITIISVSLFYGSKNNFFVKARDKIFFDSILGNKIIRVEHVGSTSVPGMSAKPIIDINVVIIAKNFQEVKERLEDSGYLYKGDLGIAGREAFRLTNKNLLTSLPEHHLYVCDKDNEELKRQIAFRDYLRLNEEDAKKYSQLKEKLAQKYPKNRDKYQEEKSWIIEEILAKIEEGKI